MLNFLDTKLNNKNLLNSGVDLLQQFNIKAGDKDFNGSPTKAKSIGASF
jgi:hypothetical protein